MFINKEIDSKTFIWVVILLEQIIYLHMSQTHFEHYSVSYIKEFICQWTDRVNSRRANCYLCIMICPSELICQHVWVKVILCGVLKLPPWYLICTVPSIFRMCKSRDNRTNGTSVSCLLQCRKCIVLISCPLWHRVLRFVLQKVDSTRKHIQRKNYLHKNDLSYVIYSGSSIPKKLMGQ